MNKLRPVLRAAAVLIFWLLIWHVLAYFIGKPLLLPSPAGVLARLFELVRTAAFWKTALYSLCRIIIGTLAAVCLGCILAVITASFKTMNYLISPLLAAVRATPVVSFIILALLWLGRDVLPAFTAFLMVVPVVWGNIHVGIKSADVKLLQVARAFQFPARRTLRRIYIPSVIPFFLSAVRSAVGLAWKAGIAAEVLTVPQNSIGRMVYQAKLNLETADLFAWTIVIILLSLIIERAALKAISRLSSGYTSGRAAV